MFIYYFRLSDKPIIEVRFWILYEIGKHIPIAKLNLNIKVTIRVVSLSVVGNSNVPHNLV